MNYYGAVTADVSQREIKNAALSRAAAEEGFVLLKNEQVLPLQTRKIALFGMGARKTTAFGEGSGSVCAYPILESAVRMINEMHSFKQASITKYFK